MLRKTSPSFSHTGALSESGLARSMTLQVSRPRWLYYRADYRTLLWVGGAAVCVGAQFVRPSLAPFLVWISAYLALTCGVIAHNHNHRPTFRSKHVNRVFGNVLSVFYGYPTFAWIPTHNLNHHKLVNRAGDATITWRYTNRHTAWVAATYFFVSSYFQSDLITAYVKKAKAQNPRLFRQIIFEYIFWLGTHTLLMALAVSMHGVLQGLCTWALACLIPSLFSLWTIMLFNYEQHVHTDPWSEHNHSRSWEGKLTNFLLFNNGLHAAHHENPGLHWSLLRKAHDALRPKIAPSLVEGGLWWYFFRQYVVSLCIPRLGTTQIGRAPYDQMSVQPVSLDADDVELGESGTNAERA